MWVVFGGDPYILIKNDNKNYHKNNKDNNDINDNIEINNNNKIKNKKREKELVLYLMMKLTKQNYCIKWFLWYHIDFLSNKLLFWLSCY